MRKMTCEVYLSTPPVCCSGSPSTTNCNKKGHFKISYELTNSIQTCPTMNRLRNNAISCIFVVKLVLQLAHLTRGGDGF